MRVSKHFFLALFFTVFLFNCGGSNEGTRVGNPPSTSATFPAGLTITSPTQTSAQAEIAALVSFPGDTQHAAVTSYEFLSDQIDDVLNGEDIEDCLFDPSAFLSTNLDAECYGPAVEYTGHPDGPDGADPLPTGDVGIWTENEGESDEACSASQLNNRMIGLQARAQSALLSLASMICVANVNSVDLPDTGSSIDLLDEMNDMATTNSIDATFLTATLSVSEDSDTGNDVYSYELAFEFTDDGTDFDLQLNMDHMPTDEDNDTYKGRFSFQFNIDDLFSGNCSSTDITKAGSVLYELSDSDSLAFRYDHGDYCGDDAAAIKSDGLLDPSDEYDAGTNSDGWGNNYNILIANLDPDTSEGNYSFSWQAGNNDSHTRVFNVNLELDSSTSLLGGTAFFGFGNQVNGSNFDGNITGFICNWAGPGNSHDETLLVQRQVIEEDTTLGVFTSDSDSLNILYAPTNSCDYDGLGTFTYDSTGDGSTDTDTGDAVENELLSLDEDEDDVLDDDDSNNVPDVIEDEGFSAPTEPENF